MSEKPMKNATENGTDRIMKLRWVGVIVAVGMSLGLSEPRTLEVDSRVVEDIAAYGEAYFLVVLKEQADLNWVDKRHRRANERIASAVGSLQEVAARSQGPVVSELGRLGLAYRPFWITNAIAAKGGKEAVERLSKLDGIERIESDRAFWVPLETVAYPTEMFSPADLEAVSGIEWNLSKIKAPELWNLGIAGQAIVYANADTGIQWDHPALKSQYRGWNGSAAEHAYNWYDAVHEEISPAVNPCGLNLTTPCDDHGHGTHTLGTGVGSDGANNMIGTAPGAKWIGCRNMESGIGRPSLYISCLQFFVAPTDLQGLNPNPALHAHVIGNSYSCTPGEGCDSTSLQSAVNNVRAAGIFMAVSAGNNGSACATVSDPPGIYDEVMSVGAVDSADNIAGFSSRGPVTVDGSNRRKPDVVAPGVGIRSSTLTSSYGSMSGTSMAAPHAAGLAALLWSAYPELSGDVALTEQILENSAAAHLTDQGCGGDTSSTTPNNVYGYGLLDALAAYELAANLLTPTSTPTATPSTTPTPIVTPQSSSSSSLPATPITVPTVPPAENTPAGDAIAPVVQALRSVGSAGSKIKLRYKVVEESGFSADTIQVKQGKRVLKTIRRSLAPLGSSSARVVSWASRGRRTGNYKFCVVSQDQAGNQSSPSCAKIKLS